MANKQQKIDAKLLDELLVGQDAQMVFSSDGLLGELRNALAEQMLDVEMDVHLHSEGEQAAGNHRNGRSPKRALSDIRAATDDCAGPARSYRTKAVREVPTVFSGF